MSFAPVIPAGGLTGWAFLNRTIVSQKKAFAADPAVQREAAYFRDNIAKARTADDLLADRRLLTVALGAFGLDGDINNRAFLRKILQDGTFEPGALGNRLADKRYLEFSAAFGFGDFPVANTQRSDFADRILKSYETRRFEKAVGGQSDAMRLALNAERELAQIAARPISENGKWFTIFGSPPLRTVFQTAFALPGNVAAIDIDKQLGIFKERAERVFGASDPATFADPRQVEKLIRLFLVRSDVQSPSAASPALSLLRGGGGAGALLSRLV